MIYRTLGNTGLKVSAISLGCEGFVGKSARETQEFMNFAIAQGINFIDIYSSNPELRSYLGGAIAPHRNQFVIQAHLCTAWEKGQYLRTRNLEKTKKSFEDLLTRLGTDHLDVGMIHYVDNEQDFHRIFDGEIIHYVQELKAQGRIRHIGLSSHNPVVARLAAESGIIEVLLFSINPCYDLQPPTTDCEELWNEKNYRAPLCNVAPEREQLYELCERNGVAIDVMKCYGGGDLLNIEDSPFGIALTPVQCIEYALTRPATAAVMLGCKGEEELGKALAWCHATREERDYTPALASAGKFTWKGHCMYCGHCAPCIAGIDIAAVHKYYNLCATQHELPETVREHYKLLEHHAGECTACGRCERNCPFGVSIIENMKRAAALFGY